MPPGYTTGRERLYLGNKLQTRDARTMFEGLSSRLEGVFDTLRGRGKLTEADVNAAAREIRIALLEARRAAGRQRPDQPRQGTGDREQVLSSVTPGQQVVKIVHDALWRP